MRGYELLDTIENLDPAYIEAAAETPKARKKRLGDQHRSMKPKDRKKVEGVDPSTFCGYSLRTRLPRRGVRKWCCSQVRPCRCSRTCGSADPWHRCRLC